MIIGVKEVSFCMKGKKYVLGVDLGTSSCKSILIDETGQVIADAVVDYPVYMPRMNWVEQDPDDWEKAVTLSIRQVLEKGEIDIEQLVGMGLSGQMHGLVALDAQGRILRPAILWNDQRSAEQCQRIIEKVGGKDNLLEMINNDMLPGYTASKILWLAENEPGIFDKARMFLNPKDYIRYKLTGDFATDVSDASGTGLFDVKKRCWNERLLYILGIQKDSLPKCFESIEITGRITGAVSESTRLPKGLPVIAGGGDAVIQTTGTGLVKEGILGTIIGTSGIVAMGLDGYKFNRRGALQIFCNNYPGTWHAMGVTLSAGASLEWFKNVLYDQNFERNAYKRMDKLAATSSAGSNGLIFLPYLFGERCPYADPSARGTFIGLTYKHRKSDMIRAVLEGVVFSLRQVAELIIECSHVPISEIRTSGGGSKSELWRQIQADVFQLPVKTVSGGRHGGAFGAALIAGVGCGIWADVFEAVEILKVETETMPNKDNKELYDSLYGIYKDMYSMIKPAFKRLGNVY